MCKDKAKDLNGVLQKGLDLATPRQRAGHHCKCWLTKARKNWNWKGNSRYGGCPLDLKARNWTLIFSSASKPQAAYATGYQQVSRGTNWLPQNHTGFLIPGHVWAFRSFKGFGDLLRRKFPQLVWPQSPFPPSYPLPLLREGTVWKRLLAVHVDQGCGSESLCHMT